VTVLKRCSRCKELKELNGVNFQPRKGSPVGWYPECCQCGRDRKNANYMRKALATDRKPSSTASRPYTSASERHEHASRRAVEDTFRPLVWAYEAARTTPGHDRAVAENLLGMALARHGSPVSCDGRIYRWVREEQSIVRMSARLR
jgi:hypothetical protein